MTTGNSRIRLEKALNLEVTERPPVIINTCVFNMKQARKRYIDCLVDPNEYVEAEVNCYREFGYDGVWTIAPMEAVGEALGSRLRFFEDDVPAISVPAIGQPEDLTWLAKENRDIKAHHRVRYLAEVVTGLKRAVGDETMVFANVHSVFRLAGMLRGINNLYMDMVLNPEFVRDLQDFCLPKCIDFALAMVEAGADVVVATNPIANGSCISRQMYEMQVHPYTKKLYQAIKESGAKVGFHSCGQWDDRYDLLVEEGMHLLWPDKVDIAWLKEKCGTKVCILGNVKTTETMLQGTPEKVRAEAVECLRKGGTTGYSLGADCVLPRDVPADNVRTLIATAKGN